MELVLDGVQFSYDRGLATEKVVLHSFSLNAREGELLSIVGRTGSGKTTLGLIMAGLLAPSRGRVTFEDAPDDPIAARERRAERGSEGAGVVMVFQFPESQFFEDRVFDEVAFGPSRLGLGDEAIQERVISAMERMTLDFRSLSNRSTLSLSEGEKRKVAIASALSCEPRFLILDEPTVSLDWEASVHIFEVLRELTKYGVSVIVMTHEVDDAVSYSDRIAVLAAGRLAASGRLAKNEIYRLLSLTS
jgi:energy-coupling factor transport system ATP-binding protein